MNIPFDRVGFDLFWDNWPKGRKEGKLKAMKAWKKLKPNKEMKDKILHMLGCFKRSRGWMGDVKYIPHPSSWLNQRRFNDESIDGRTIVMDETKDSPGVTRYYKLIQTEKERSLNNDELAEMKMLYFRHSGEIVGRIDAQEGE